MKGMMIRLALIALKLCFVSSVLAANEGYGFSTAGHWIGEIKEMSTQTPLLRGLNHTDLETSEDLSGAIGGDFDGSLAEFDDDIESDDEEAEYIYDFEWNSNDTTLEDESDERHLAQMSNRDRQWLNSHNKRRNKYHSKYNKKYVPLKWSPKLKRSSKKWAKHLANICGRQGIYHDPANSYGENLAANWGTGSWAKRPSTESVLTRLVENEEKLGYPKNGHFTQVLWRATTLVGCAEHTKVFRDGSGKKCHVQVCRYAKPGNCNMSRYKNYEVPMLADSSPCGPNN